MNPLLGDLDAAQKRLIELLATTFRTHGAWPPWQFVEQTMVNEGLDPVGIIAGLPEVGRSRGIYGLTYGLVWTRGNFGSLYQPSDPVGLTVAGWHQAGADDIVSLFLGTLGLATRKLREFVPDPLNVIEIFLTSADVVGDLEPQFNDGLPLQSSQLYEVLSQEPSMWSGSRGLMEDGEWRWQIGSEFRRYNDISTIEQYVDEIKVVADESALAADRLIPFLPEPQTVDNKDELIDLGLVEKAPPMTDDAPVVEPQQLFLSWGRPASETIAAALKPIFEGKLAGVAVFFSPTSIEPGDDPSTELFDTGLRSSQALAVVLTSEGAGSPYVIWETAASWGRGQLVIPMFVDIEPSQVPGPLASKVQGIRLKDRPDLVRAIARLQRHFGIVAEPELSDAEWTSLETAMHVVGLFPESATEGPPTETAAPEPVLPGWPRRELPIYYCGPTSWHPPSDPEQPDIILRVAIALPNVIAAPYGQDGISRLRGEEREQVVTEALEDSPFTTWLQSQRDAWHWQDDPVWKPYGTFYADFSEYRFQPTWPASASRRPPLQARLSVATGLLKSSSPETTGPPALQLACDLMFSLLELDEQRMIGDIRHATTPVPIPGALSMEEILEALLQLWTVADIAETLSEQLLPTGDYAQGQIAAWIQLRSVQIERVINLDGLRRNDGGTDAPDASTAARWPLVAESGEAGDPRTVIAEMIADFLERSMYRGLDEVKVRLRG